MERVRVKNWERKKERERLDTDREDVNHEGRNKERYSVLD